MKRVLFTILLFLPLFGYAHGIAEGHTGDKRAVYQGFSGGMMLHTGYLFGQSAAPAANDWSGATFGIGGALRVNLMNHLRIGGEGFVSTMPSVTTNLHSLLQPGSYVRNGWGGIIVDACWRDNERIWPYFGASFGGGSCKSLYIYEGNQSDWLPETNTIYNKQPYMYIDPYVAIDYCMTPKVHLTLRLDWQLAFNVRQSALMMPTGPRLYFGFMFCH